MIGKTNSQTDVIRDERVNVLLTTNQSSHDDLKGAVITIAYENVRDEYEYTGSMLTAKVPPYVSYTISVSDVAGYAKPAAVSAKAVAGNSRSVTMTYNTTVVTVKMADNQSAYNDIAGATATVAASGISTVTVKDGGSVKVPTGVSCSVTWSAVSGYKTPDKQTFTTSGTSVSKTGTYQTEILTVTVTSDIDLPASYTITVRGIGSQTTSSKTYKVPFGASYTVSASQASGYKTPATQSFVANSANRTVNVRYLKFKIGSWITIDQNISDPATMISGEVNGEHIQLIRQNSHRYLGKYTAENTMTICQLDDNNSNMFHDGRPAILTGSHGDVFMRLPRFWYKAVEKSTDVWNIGFYCGDEIDELEDWMEWDGNDLIGVYKAVTKNNLAYSISGGKTSKGADVLEYATNRGIGFSSVRWKHHCILAFLFYAMYGSTNSQSILSPNTEQIGYTIETGYTDNYGMKDSLIGSTVEISGAQNFWGLENWTGGVKEVLGDARSKEKKLYILNDDGSERIIEGDITAGFAKKMLIGDFLDLVPTKDFGSATTYFCDRSSPITRNTDYSIIKRAGHKNIDDTGISASTVGDSMGDTLRLAFRGTLVLASDTSSFIQLTPIL